SCGVVGGVTFNFEWIFVVRDCECGRSGDCLFENIKCLLLVFSPFPICLSGENRQWFGNFSIVLDKSSVKVRES
ncbi:hypothetical protein SERLA73DRAFT_49783, partial [Serpula lacrymans var. lacrymans S7.3]